MIYLIHGWLCNFDPDNTEDPVRDSANIVLKFYTINLTKSDRFWKDDIFSYEMLEYIVDN